MCMYSKVSPCSNRNELLKVCFFCSAGGIVLFVLESHIVVCNSYKEHCNCSHQAESYCPDIGSCVCKMLFAHGRSELAPVVNRMNSALWALFRFYVWTNVVFLLWLCIERSKVMQNSVLPVTGTVFRQQGISLSTEQDRCHSTCSACS